MIFKCRLCKKDFESSSYKPYCEPHALAYEQFKRAKNSPGGDNDADAPLVKRQSQVIVEKGDETGDKRDRVSKNNNDRVSKNSATKPEKSEDDSAAAADFVTIAKSETDGNEKSRTTSIDVDSAGGYSRVDTQRSLVERRPKDDGNTSDVAHVVDSATSLEDRADLLSSPGRRRVTPTVTREAAVADTRSNDISHLVPADGDPSLASPFSTVPDFGASHDVRSSSKSATPVWIDGETDDIYLSNNWIDSNFRSDVDDDDAFSKEVKTLISRDDSGPEGVLCPIAFNYYYGSDDDDLDEEDEEDYLEKRIISGGKTLSSLGLKPIVYAEDEHVGEGKNDHDYARTRFPSSFESKKARVDAEEREERRRESFVGEDEEKIVFSASSRFMSDEEERVDLSQLSLVHILRQMAAYPFSRETELQYLKDARELATLKDGEGAGMKEETSKGLTSDRLGSVNEATVSAASMKRTKRSVTPDGSTKASSPDALNPTSISPSAGRPRVGRPKAPFSIHRRGVGRARPRVIPIPPPVDRPRVGRGRARGRPRTRPWTRPSRDETFYPNFPNVTAFLHKQKIKAEEDDDSPTAETKRSRRTRGIKLDYNAMNEGDLFFNDREELPNWGPKAKAETNAQKTAEAEGEEVEEEVKRQEAESEEERRDCRVRTASKSLGCCKVCGVECEMEMKVPYCKTHADMFQSFRLKQLAQLGKGHVD